MFLKYFIIIILIWGTFDQCMVNGQKTFLPDIVATPFLVSIQTDTRQHDRNGVMISQSWLVTSALSMDVDITRQYVQYNSTFTTLESDFIVEIETIIIHEGFTSTHDAYQNMNCISLIKTRTPVFITRFAPLPAQFSDIMPGAMAITYAWDPHPVSGAELLHRAEVPIISDRECANDMNAVHDQQVFQSNICARIGDNGGGPCNEWDNGSAIFVNGVFVGIFAWTIDPPCDESHPVAFTQISYFREWIRQRSGV